MKLGISTVAATLISTTPVVTASPTTPPRQITPTTGTVVACTLPSWRGLCTTLTVPLEYGSCTALTPPFLYNISSFEPVYGTVCWLQYSTDCSDLCMSPEGCDEIVEFPGYANLSTYGYPPWSVQGVGSFTCEPSTFVPS